MNLQNLISIKGIHSLKESRQSKGPVGSND